jgi:uncharacterized RDD family membrane protein YckC
VTNARLRRVGGALLLLVGLWFLLYAVIDPFAGSAAHTVTYWALAAGEAVVGVVAIIVALRLWRRRAGGDAARIRFGIRHVPAERFDVGDTNVVWRRVFAHLIDWTAYTMLVVAIVVAGPYGLPDSWLITPHTSAYLWLPIAAIANWVVLQGLTGYSVGKWILRIRVVGEDGRPPGIRRAFLRALPLVIEQYGVVAIWAMRRSPARQRFGDRWASTYVVRVLRRRRVGPARVPAVPSA